MRLTKQEISDLILSCETLMEQLYDDRDNIEFNRIRDLRDKLNK